METNGLGVRLGRTFDRLGPTALKLLVITAAAFLCGFGAPSHAAVSNQTLDELEQSIQSSTPELRFHGLRVPVVQDRSAYAAILEHPEYFRMGSFGPDAFPELGSGQLFHHVNQGVLPTNAFDLPSGSPRAAFASNRPFEMRTPNTYRSIDVGMRMLNLALSPRYRGDPRVLAFAMGFLSHSVGDGFMHPRVNELSGDYFWLFRGGGAFGKISEELKHNAIEDLLDQRLPSELLNSDPNFNSNDLLDGRAPLEFLDDFYSQGATFDRVGGPVYDWFGLQEDALDAAILALDPLRALPSLEQMLVDAIVDRLADATGNAVPLNVLVQAARQILQLLPPNALAELATGRFNVLAFNAEQLQRKLIAYRKNLMLLSECTMRNVSQAAATENVVDYCASTDTLSRINLNGVLNPAFPDELEELFIGEPEADTDLRSRPFNIKRVAKYLLASFKLKDAAEIVMPISISDALTVLRNFVESHRQEINQAFFVVLPTLENLMVAADAAVCHRNCFQNQCVPRLSQCINGAVDFCNTACNRDLGPVTVNLCSLNPCNGLPPIPGLSSLCNEVLGGFTPPDLCVGLDFLGNCILELGRSNIDCATCTLNCQRDAFTAFQQLDVVGLMLDVIDGVKAQVDDVKEFIKTAVIEPAACVAVQQVMRQQFTELRAVLAVIDFVFERADPPVSPDFFAVNMAFLKEDLAEDPVYRDAVLAGASLEARRAIQTIQNNQALNLFIDPDEKGFELGCFDFSFEARDFSGSAVALQRLTALHATPGPQARRLMGEFGSNVIREFSPMQNAIAGNKLIPLRSRTDVEAMFQAQGVPNTLLPWRSNRYSAICADNGDGSINLFCDVVNSNDDPACLGCMVQPPNPTPTRQSLERDLELVDGIHWRRSLSACASEEEKAELGKPNVTTPFPLANRDAAFEGLYSKIFHCPAESPRFSDLDEPEDVSGWKTSPNGQLSFDPNRKSTGAGSMRICGSGYIAMVSPSFDTAEWGKLSDTLAIDVFTPAQTPPPAWWGALQLQVHIPAANLYNAWVGQLELTGAVVRGAWTTLSFHLPPEVLAALEGDFPNAELHFNLNVPSGPDCWGFDNIRFENPHFRSTFHRVGSRQLDVSTSDFFSFENAGDWSSTSPGVQQNFDLVEHGRAALEVPGAGYTAITSRAFHTNEIRVVGDRLSLDVYVPATQPNPFWVGQVQAYFSCPAAGVENTYLGGRDITHTFRDEYNALTFDLPANVRAALLGSFPGCRFSLALNVNAGSGRYLFDKLGFLNGVAK